MSQINNGKILNKLTSPAAMGGTEIMRNRLLQLVDNDLLKGVCIHFSRVYDIEPKMKNILYLHDLPFDIRYEKLKDKNILNSYAKFVFVSYHQRDLFIQHFDLPYSKCVVIKNAIGDYFNPNSKKENDGPVKIIYHTTPHRGLELLLPVFNELVKEYDVTLDVFSSFKIYGWEENDVNYQSLFDKINNTDNITYHGSQPNSVVLDYLKKSDMFIYPCIWHETSCLALMEAIQNGCICIHPDFGALPETAQNMTYMFPMSESYNDVANRTYSLSKYILDNYSSVTEDMQIKSSRFIPYSLLEFKRQWENVLQEIKNG